MNVRQLAARVEPGRTVHPQGAPQPAARGTPPQTSFADALRRASDQDPPFTLSAHAQQRIEQRGISMDEGDRQRIEEALRLLESKGARDALLLRSDAAFVVNVPNRTVVTAISQDELRDRVFTQIDSAVLV